MEPLYYVQVYYDMVLIKTFSIDLFTGDLYLNDDDFFDKNVRLFFWRMLRQIADSGNCSDLAIGNYGRELSRNVPRFTQINFLKFSKK
jgi:hypothetical protein